MPPLRGKPGVFPFFQFLETKLPVGGGTKFGTALSQYAAQAKNVGIAVILSDFFDETHGGWHEQLTEDMQPSYSLFKGKGDIYHALQACLIPLYPATGSITRGVIEASKG